MADKLDDLLPLFLAEAGDRLDRITMLLEQVAESPEAAHKVRRELHALKGASRMMGLGELSELCHQAEELSEATGERRVADLLQAVDQLVRTVNELRSSPQEREEEGPQQESTTDSDQPAPTLAGIFEGSNEMRVSRELLDTLTDRGARLRVLAVRATGFLDRLLSLERMAVRGVNGDSPQQVLATLATKLRQLTLEMEGGQRMLSHHADFNLDVLLRLQVQPLRPFLLNLARHARELARSLGREVEISVSAGNSQLDQRIIAALEVAFLHLVRNAVDHGIESPQERKAAGKPATGQIRLEASSEGRRVLIKVSDDGVGIDPQRLLAAATSRGLISDHEAARLSRDEQLQLVLQPGLSTRDAASEISGRGVGMDAVAEAVRSIGGDVWIDSEPGKGTTVTLEVPSARRGERILVLQVADAWMGLPVSAVRSFRQVRPEMVIHESGRHLLRIDDRVLDAHFLCDLFGVEETRTGVLIEGMLGNQQLSLVADAVVGEEEVLLRPLPNAAGAPPFFDGLALLASGRPVPVLSPHRLSQREAARAATPVRSAPPREIRVLLVDDSLVTREMIQRLLEDAGFRVVAAPGAEEALRLVAEQHFDCLVTDIEMPDIDGLELTRHLRASAQHAHLPIVVVSTRDRTADRLAGLDAGADAYFTKQGLDSSELIALIHRVGGHA